MNSVAAEEIIAININFHCYFAIKLSFSGKNIAGAFEIKRIRRDLLMRI